MICRLAEKNILVARKFIRAGVRGRFGAGVIVLENRQPTAGCSRNSYSPDILG